MSAEQLTSPLKSYTFVGVQFACLGLIGLTGPLVASRPLSLAAELAGGLLGVWGIVSMRFGNFNITPDVRAGAELVERGPYRYIRHPMYAALLLATLPLVAERPTAPRIGLWLLLAADLVLKLGYEEQLLEREFAGYAAYRRRTKRLIPFLY